MTPKHCILIGAPVESGTGRAGCEMGPSAFRAAGLAQALTDLGHAVTDRGLVTPGPLRPLRHHNPALKSLAEIVAWTEAIERAVYQAGADGLPIVIGGDHSIAAGTLSGHARRAGEAGRKLFVLWLDAHPDFHTLDTTTSGNLHGVPVAYATGQPGFNGIFPPLPYPLDPRNFCMIGIRSVDPAERLALARAEMPVFDMRAIDQEGIGPIVDQFLRRVKAENGLLHVSIDVDFLDPEIAPAVGTTVPGGATFREAHLAMEIVHDSGLLNSLDLVELNPFLDVRGKTALLMVDLAASLLGRRVLDRPTLRGGY